MDRHLAAILAADVVGYSSLIKQDELGTIADVKANLNDLIEPKIAEHKGRIVKLMGDGLLAEFPSVVDAVQCAVDIQQNITERFSNGPNKTNLVYRMGINIGDIVVEGDDIHGDGVNVAARLETLSKPGGICIAHNVFDQVKDKLDLNFEHLGKKKIKNIAEPVTIYGVNLDDKAATLATPVIHLTKKSGRSVGTYAMAATFALLIMIGGLTWWQSRAPEFEPVSPESMAQPLPLKPSIAVLAFDDLSVGSDAGYVSDAIGEGIITELSRFSEFFVIARNSSFKYRGVATDVRKIAQELSVQYVLEGSQQKSGDKLRVTVQLIDAVAGNHIWAETYNRNIAELFVIQDEIVRKIASRVGAEIAFRPPPSSDLARVSALQHHLKARQYYRQWTREGTEQARLLNLKAIEADPTSPFGYIGLTFVYGRGYTQGWTELDPQEALARAQESANKALELDPDNYDSHYARGWLHSKVGEQNQAMARMERSIELNPSATNVMAALTEPLVYTGQYQKAVEMI